jgi:hypothetical protein
MRRTIAVLLALSSLLEAGALGDRVLYVGGTVAGVPSHSNADIDVRDENTLSLRLRDKAVSVAWADVTNIEYGLHVDRRYLEAILISPLFLIAKKRTHFLTIGYTDREGHQQAVVLEVSKSDIRQLLVSLETRSGRRVEYQDDEARKAGKG